MNNKGILETIALAICLCVIGIWFLSTDECKVTDDLSIITDGAMGKDALTDDARGTEPPSFEMNVSAYCPCSKCCGKFADGITASGHKIKLGDKFVAAPKNIPFGTMMSIQGCNNGFPVPVLDRGGAIKGNKLDVYFDTHQEALNWGRQSLMVKVLKK